jgi:hypothetical protein
MPIRFEDMTIAQVHARAAGEWKVQRGKALYAERPWTQLRDEMTESEVRTVGDLPRARVRELRAATKPRAS